MVCVYCTGETQVTNSRHQKRNNQVWRRRKCIACQAIFTTLEGVDLSTTLRVEKSDGLRPFVTDLLFVEVLFALSDRKNAYIDAREVTNTIIQALLGSASAPVFLAKEISLATASVLKRLDTRAWHRYAADHPSVTA